MLPIAMVAELLFRKILDVLTSEGQRIRAKRQTPPKASAHLLAIHSSLRQIERSLKAIVDLQSDAAAWRRDNRRRFGKRSQTGKDLESAL